MFCKVSGLIHRLVTHKGERKKFKELRERVCPYSIISGMIIMYCAFLKLGRQII